MKNYRQFTGIIEKEGNSYVSLCPELDISSQGDAVKEVRNNLIEALELFFETADPKEIQQRLYKKNLFITPLEVAVG